MKENPTDSSQTEASQNDGFQEGIAYQATTEDGLALHLDGYDGPLHILLALARTQKVDLKQISILKLAEQYLDFIREAQDLKIELAADYLVMASWLAYLKSRLILPPPHDDEVIDAEEMAARLVFRLKCLEAMREASAQLMGRDLLGRDFFVHGMPEGIRIKRQSTYDASLYEVLGAYSTQRLRNHYERWSPPKMDVLSIERARMRIERLLGKLDDWESMDSLVAGDMRDPQKRRTTMASSFSAFLEYARDGRVELQQSKNFESLLVRRARPKAAVADNIATEPGTE
ncbi:segregation/condensation protein A [Alphaproteobacteria bacterium]|nr:segregation/condensation protein A [Alphaproteobacteria bacterium]